MERIIGDLRVLAKHCSEDIARQFYANISYYRNELNRIIGALNDKVPNLISDVKPVSPPSRRAVIGICEEELAVLFEVSAVADKLLVRLTKEYGEKIDSVATLEMIFYRFHDAARQLRSRYDDRQTLDVKDEYDVQDLLHVLLKSYFDDIRPEEWTPSYAGSSSRMDFLLKNEQVVVEVKKTRNKLRDKEIGEQLIVDITKYKGHPDCKSLLCFVYDPEGNIGNPKGLENDLGKLSTDVLTVKVFVFPK